MNNGEFCKSCGKRTVLSVNGYACINPTCPECETIKSDAFPVNDEQKYANEKIKKGDLVFIKDPGIYGNVNCFWEACNSDGETEYNYIIKDILGIEHERWESEIEKVENIEDSIRNAKCNAPLETIINLFNEINRKYKLVIEVSKEKEDAHSDVIVSHVFVRYGGMIYDKKSNKFFENPCYIKNGEIFLPEEEDYVGKDDEYECAISCLDADVKEIVFELYMNIITRLKK